MENKQKTQEKFNNGVYNQEAFLNNNGVCFICESIDDAKAINYNGGYAMALTRDIMYFGGKINQILFGGLDDKEISKLDINKYYLVLRKYAEDIQNQNAFGIISYFFDKNKLKIERYDVLRADYNNISERLTNDPTGFKQDLNKVILTATDTIKTEQEIKKDCKYTHSISQLLANYNQNIEDFKNPYPTGFKKLDEILNGGLRAGLYTVGGMPCVGKTTFALNIAEHIAEQESPVIFFTFEMTSDEILTKLISKKSFFASKDKNNACSFEEVANHTPSKIKIIEKCQEDLNNSLTAKYLILIDRNLGGLSDTEFIKNKIQYYINNELDKTPVVFVDYLQKIEPSQNERNKYYSNERSITETNIRELKNISRLFNLPIVVLSSVNRESYRTTVDGKETIKELTLSSLKESGLIEYESDKVLLLNDRTEYQKAHSKTGDSKLNDRTEEYQKAHSKKGDSKLIGGQRLITITIPKNRTGETATVNDKINLILHGKFNYFEDENAD